MTLVPLSPTPFATHWAITMGRLNDARGMRQVCATHETDSTKKSRQRGNKTHTHNAHGLDAVAQQIPMEMRSREVPHTYQNARTREAP